MKSMPTRLFLGQSDSRRNKKSVFDVTPETSSDELSVWTVVSWAIPDVDLCEPRYLFIKYISRYLLNSFPRNDREWIFFDFARKRGSRSVNGVNLLDTYAWYAPSLVDFLQVALNLMMNASQSQERPNRFESHVWQRVFFTKVSWRDPSSVSRCDRDRQFSRSKSLF